MHMLIFKNKNKILPFHMAPRITLFHDFQNNQSHRKILYSFVTQPKKMFNPQL